MQLHGGVYVARKALATVLCGGSAPGGGLGEFTRRAFENGRIDLAEAEAVMGLISAHRRAGGPRGHAATGRRRVNVYSPGAG